jgi:hypothetical protein
MTPAQITELCKIQQGLNRLEKRLEKVKDQITDHQTRIRLGRIIRDMNASGQIGNLIENESDPIIVEVNPNSFNQRS